MIDSIYFSSHFTPFFLGGYFPIHLLSLLEGERERVECKRGDVFVAVSMLPCSVG